MVVMKLHKHGLTSVIQAVHVQFEAASKEGGSDWLIEGTLENMTVAVVAFRLVLFYGLLVATANAKATY